MLLLLSGMYLCMATVQKVGYEMLDNLNSPNSNLAVLFHIAVYLAVVIGSILVSSFPKLNSNSPSTSPS